MATVRRCSDEARDQGDLRVAARLAAEHHTVNANVIGRANVSRGMVQLREAFPDLRRTIDDLIADGDKVVARTTFRGTHRGAFLGLPPTGRRVSWSSITIYRIVNGQVAEEWPVSDRL